MKKHNIVLIFVSAAWLIVFAGRLIAPTLLVDIETELAISDTQAGIALTGMWLFYGLMQYPSGILSDSWGRKKVIMISLFIFGIAVVLTGFSINYFMLIATLSLMGAAAGSVPSSIFAMISESFDENKGRAFGIQSSIGSLSGLVPGLIPILAYAVGWRNIFFLWGGLTFILLYLFYHFITETLNEPTKRKHLDTFKSGIKSLSEKDTAFMFLINVLVSSAWMGMISWYPTYLQKAKGLSVEQAGILFSVVLLGGLLIKPIVGSLSDSVNRLWLMMILAFAASISLYLLTLYNSYYILIIISFVFAQTGAFFPVRTSYLTDLWYSKTVGARMGVFMSAIILLGSPISAIVGFTKESYGFDTAIIGVAAAQLIASFLLAVKLVRDRLGPEEKCM